MQAVRVSNRVITLKNGKKCWVVIKNAQRNKRFLWLQVERVSNVDFKEADHPRDKKNGQFVEKDGSDGVGSNPEKISKKETKKNYGFGNVPNVNMDDFFSFNPDDYEDYSLDDFMKDSGLKKSERNFVKDFFENPIVKISGQNKKKEIFKNYKKGELHTPEDVLFNLFDLGVEQESSKKFAEQLGMADVKYIKDLLYGTMIKYPEMLHYSDTLGLDVLTVSKPEKSVEKSSKKGSMKGVMKKLSEYKGKEGGTYSYETGEPVEKSDGFFVSFHQNEADEKGNFKSHFGKYTEDEYDVLTNDFIYDNGLEATVGTYDTDPELSGWTKDYQKAFDLMVKYNQKSMWDVEAGGEILNPKYDKKKNPMREDVNE